MRKKSTCSLDNIDDIIAHLNRTDPVHLPPQASSTHRFPLTSSHVANEPPQPSAHRSKKRKGEAEEECKELLTAWQRDMWLLQYSDCSFGPQGLLPDKILKKLAQDQSICSMEDMRTTPSVSEWVWLPEHAEEVLELLRPINKRFAAQEENKRQQQQEQKQRKAAEQKAETQKHREEKKQLEAKAKAQRRAEEEAESKQKCEAMWQTYWDGMRQSQDVEQFRQLQEAQQFRKMQEDQQLRLIQQLNAQREHNWQLHLQQRRCAMNDAMRQEYIGQDLLHRQPVELPSHSGYSAIGATGSMLPAPGTLFMGMGRMMWGMEPNGPAFNRML
jgi:pyruvate/2-oxoglutarate dehydrogenase complex dihydrolipoamide acyltransferase (E2) component